MPFVAAAPSGQSALPPDVQRDKAPPLRWDGRGLVVRVGQKLGNRKAAFWAPCA